MEDKGYRKPLQRNTPHFPVENLNVIGKLVNNVGSVHSNTFTVEINISFQTSLPSHAHETQTDIPSVYDKN